MKSQFDSVPRLIAAGIIAIAIGASHLQAGIMVTGSPGTMDLGGLQIGAYANAAKTEFVPYLSSSTDPMEHDTAIVYGGDPFSIAIAGITSKNSKSLLQLGGEYSGGGTWEDFNAPSWFSDNGAVLMLTVGSGDYSGLTVGGVSYFKESDDFVFPNNHAPLQDASVQKFLYFDIGNFEGSESIPDFADGSVGQAKGEIMDLEVANGGNLSFIHFDVLAIATDEDNQSMISSTLGVNAGSHDLTWKPNATPPPSPVPGLPEPSSFAIFGTLMLALGVVRGRRRNVIA